MLSCWETHLPTFMILDEGRFSSRILRYTAPSTCWSRSIPLTEWQPQSTTFPPPCLTVWMVLFGSYSAFLKHGGWTRKAKTGFGCHLITASRFLSITPWCNFTDSFTNKGRWLCWGFYAPLWQKTGEFKGSEIWPSTFVSIRDVKRRAQRVEWHFGRLCKVKFKNKMFHFSRCGAVM